MKNILKQFLTFMVLLGSSSVFAINVRTIGKNRLLLSKGLEVKLERYDEVVYETHREWKVRLVLNQNGKTIFKKYPIEDGILDGNIFYFVPIVNGKYILDLNGDDKREFAVVHEHGGNAPATSVTVFSLRNKRLKVFKKAWYAMEGGNSVIWNEKDAPRKCFYTPEGACEYL